ncbi:MAG TPA: DUF993 family protein [Egibacteraceae bacterium]|nr:DUF993 family protein [Egibacteraceae bacterium]
MTALSLDLPTADGQLRSYTLQGRPAEALAGPPPKTRLAFAAPHVIPDPLRASASDPGVVDMSATLAVRRRLWDLGLAVAEVMDTSQRGMGLDWSSASALVEASLDAARTAGGRIACGAGTDHLPADQAHDLGRIRDAYLEQCSFIEERGGQVILMASRALAAASRTPEDYLQIYDDVLTQLRAPVILHWLGPAFDPQLTGYWGSADLAAAAETLLALICDHDDQIEGVKVSCLDRDLELALRRRLPDRVRMFTGDDFNYVELIEGDEGGHSDALLGIFSAIAPAAALALRALDAGDVARYRAVLDPTLPLSRHLFAAPTRYYKTGIAFLAWLNGHQAHFRMLAGLESSRSVLHLTEAFILADRAGALADPQLAVHRMGGFLALAGAGRP